MTEQPPETPPTFFEDPYIRLGAKFGSGAGFVIAVSYMQIHSAPFNFYPGNDALVFAVCIGGGLLAGVVGGWLYRRWPQGDAY